MQLRLGGDKGGPGWLHGATESSRLAAFVEGRRSRSSPRVLLDVQLQTLVLKDAELLCE